MRVLVHYPIDSKTIHNMDTKPRIDRAPTRGAA